MVPSKSDHIWIDIGWQLLSANWTFKLLVEPSKQTFLVESVSARCLEKRFANLILVLFKLRKRTVTYDALKIHHFFVALKSHFFSPVHRHVGKVATPHIISLWEERTIWKLRVLLKCLFIPIIVFLHLLSNLSRQNESWHSLLNSKDKKLYNY